MKTNHGTKTEMEAAERLHILTKLAGGYTIRLQKDNPSGNDPRFPMIERDGKPVGQFPKASLLMLRQRGLISASSGLSYTVTAKGRTALKLAMRAETADDPPSTLADAGCWDGNAQPSRR